MTLAELIEELREYAESYPHIANLPITPMQQDRGFFLVMGDYPEGRFGSVQLRGAGFGGRERLIVSGWGMHTVGQEEKR